MSFINYSSREINVKLVYYGPGLCGKTTNLHYIYRKTNPEAKGKMISLATETERTLFFDFLPLALGEIRGFKTRFHLYTVPGQVFYDASRKLILKGVDGIAFVADSQLERMEANVESLDNLRINLAEQGYNLDTIPYVIQYNKRDLPNIATVEELAHFPLLAHPAPRTVLVVGGGAGGVLAEILKHETVSRIDYVEIDPLLLGTIRDFPTPLTAGELASPRVRLHFGDARLFLRQERVGVSGNLRHRQGDRFHAACLG